LGVEVGVGLGEGVAVHGFHRGQHEPSARVPWRQLGDCAAAAGVAVAVGMGEGLAAAATPEAPASMSANTPGNSAIAARPLARRRGSGM
jgi:hypothetical protein